MEKSKALSKKFARILEKEGILALAKHLVKKFRGAEVFLVGGAVRDVILGRPIKDIDVLVRKVKVNDLEKFLGKSGAVNLVGKRFGVFKFTPRGGQKQIDIALPRTDFSFGTGVYKDFKIKSNPSLPIEDDLARRDFTMNAMAWDIYNNRSVDPYGGLDDLNKKIIRTVGAPKDRFAEDYSRMLRAIRFAMQLNFKIEPKTWAAIKKYIGRINDLTESSERKVPYEVIASEFLKSFDARPAETIKKYLECGAIQKLMPEIMKMKECGQPKKFHSEGNVLTHTLLALENLNSKMFRQYFPAPVSLTVKAAILLHDIGKPAAKKQVGGRTVFYNHDKIGAKIARNFLERLKMSAPPGLGVNIEEIVRLVGNHLLFFYSPAGAMKKTTIEKYLFHKVYSGEAHMQVFLADAMATRPANGGTDFMRFKEAYKIWQSLKGRRKAVPPEPILDGNEVMKLLKIAPGPKVGEVLESLREEQLNGRIKNKNDAEKFILSLRAKRGRSTMSSRPNGNPVL